MVHFDGLNCMYKGSVKDIYQDDKRNLYFKFSDRFSIYDWGEMPDKIPNKGKALAAMSTSFFKFLDFNQVNHHFLESTKGSDYIKVQKVDVLKPTLVKNVYDYSEYEKRPTNTLVPLEVIFRLGLPEGSSFFKRANDSNYLDTLSVDQVPAQGEFFKEPIIEFSTKLEPLDRYLSYTEAKHISGMTDTELKDLINLTKNLSLKLNSLFTRMDLELWDGKFEFAFHIDDSGRRSFKLVDTIGLDELRVLKDGAHLSKEVLRQYYQDTTWIKQLSHYKGTFGDNWKKNMIHDGFIPNNLDKSFLDLVSEMYTAFSKDLRDTLNDIKPNRLDMWKEKFDKYQEQKKMNILVIGNGGREHALAWKLIQSPKTQKVFITDTKHAMLGEREIESLDLKVEKTPQFLNSLSKNSINFVVIGPEAPLVDGIADFLRANGIVVFGPGGLGAKLEESKNFSKNIMMKAGIPTADFKKFTKSDHAFRFIENTDWKDGYVIKADGLASGKGVIVTSNKEDAKKAVYGIMVNNELDLDDTTIIIEERLIGPEVSVFALIDNKTFKTIGNACDYKRIRDNDEGPNTGGMGTYSPCEWLDSNDEAFINEKVFAPLVKQLKIEKIDYNGVIFAGFMKTNTGLRVLEFNVRFGDPETQSLLPRIENDFFELLYKTATNELDTVSKIDLKPQTVVNIVCAAHGYPGTEGVAVRKDDSISVNEQMIKNGKVFYAGVKKDKDLFKTSGGRVLGVTSWADDKNQARELAYQNIKYINFEGMQYRNDIAK